MNENIIIPHDEQAEAGALACVIEAGDSRMLDRLEEPDFHDVRHLSVFRSLTAIQTDGEAISSVSLFQRLKDNGESEVADYAATKLGDATPSPANFPRFLETIKDRAERRRMLAEAEMTRQRALNIRVPVECSIKESLDDRLKSRLFDYRVKIEEPPPRFSIGSTGISTPGNLTTITAGVKAGKSSFIGAILASTMTTNTPVDCLGLVSRNPEGMTVVHFDTEQSRADHHAGIARVMRRANTTTAPDWLHSYCVTGFTVRELRTCLREALSHSGRIHSVLLDGAADYVADVNDPAECNDFVAELHELAINHECPIVGVIHFNPGTEKSRGHLGSQLERKAETNLRLDKDESEIITAYSLKSRRAPITKSMGPRFAWSSADGMHVSVESLRDAKAKADFENLLEEATRVFDAGRKTTLRYNEIKGFILSLKICKSEPTAKRRMGSMIELGIIKKELAGFYSLNT
jgi:hypothetical protein